MESPLGSHRVRPRGVGRALRQEVRKVIDKRKSVTADVAVIVKRWMDAEITCEEMIEGITVLSARIDDLRCPSCGAQK